MTCSAVAPDATGEAIIGFAAPSHDERGPGRLLRAVVANAIGGNDRQRYQQRSPGAPVHEAAGIVAQEPTA